MGSNTGDIREAIDHTRSQLSDTLEALSYKTDVPARAKETVSHAMDAVRSGWQDAGQSLKEAGKDLGSRSEEILRSGEEILRSGQENAQRAGAIADDVLTKVFRNGVRFVEQNPVTATIISTAAGMFLSRMLPFRKRA